MAGERIVSEGDIKTVPGELIVKELVGKSIE